MTNFPKIARGMNDAADWTTALLILDNAVRWQQARLDVTDQAAHAVAIAILKDAAQRVLKGDAQ